MARLTLKIDKQKNGNSLRILYILNTMSIAKFISFQYHIRVKFQTFLRINVLLVAKGQQ